MFSLRTIYFFNGNGGLKSMKKYFLIAAIAAATSFWAMPAHATLIGVVGGASSAETGPLIIGAPSDITDDSVTNTGMQGFDEAQGVLTTVAHTTDTGVIAAGTWVDSHMIFLNSPGGLEPSIL